MKKWLIDWAPTLGVLNETSKLLISLVEKHASGKAQPLVITHRGNSRGLRAWLGRRFADIVLPVEDLNDAEQTAAEVVEYLSDRGDHLINWVNVQDAYTPMFLHTVHCLGLKFPFLNAYAACRIKPVARLLARKNNLSNIDFQVFDLASGSGVLPSVKLPFVVKPIAGAGSRGVVKIESEDQWFRVFEKPIKHSGDTARRSRGTG